MLLTLPIEQKFDMEKLPTFSKRHGQNIRKIRVQLRPLVSWAQNWKSQLRSFFPYLNEIDFFVPKNKMVVIKNFQNLYIYIVNSIASFEIK